MKNILILANNTLSQTSFKNTLSEEHQVFICSSINEAIYKLMNEKIDFVIYDSTIRAPNFKNFLNLLKDLYPHIKVLLLNYEVQNPSLSTNREALSENQITQVVKQLLEESKSADCIYAAS